MKRVAIFSFFLLYLFSPLLLVTVVAQENANAIVINYQDTEEDLDYLLLDVYFTLLDSDGRATPTEIDEANLILLRDNTVYTTTMKQSETDRYVTFVVQTGGDMGPESLTTIGDEIVDFATNELDGAYLAIMQFDRSSDPITFNQDPNELDMNLNDVPTGACLYNAIYDAVRDTANEGPDDGRLRRAVIVFTNGQHDDDCNSSDNNPDDIIDLVREENNRVAVHILGQQLQNSIQKAILENISRETGGQFYEDASNLSGQLDTIYDSLESQHHLQAFLRPSKGDHTAILLLLLNKDSPDQVILPQSIEFNSGTNYIGPITVDLIDLQLNANHSYNLTLALENFKDGDTLAIRVWGEENNLPLGNVISYTVNLSDARAQIPLTGVNFQPEQEYRLEVKGVNSENQSLQNQEGNPTLLSYTFRHPATTATAPIMLRLSSPALDSSGHSLVVEVDSIGDDERFQSHRLRLVNAATNLNAISPITLTITHTQMITIAMQTVASGDYLLVLEALDEDNRPLAEPATLELTYQSLSLGRRMTAALRQQGGIRLLIILVIVTPLVWTAIHHWRTRRNNPLAFGKKILKKELKEPVRYQPTDSKK